MSTIPANFKFRSTGNSETDIKLILFLFEQGRFSIPFDISDYIRRYVAMKDICGFAIADGTIGVFLRNLNEDDYTHMAVEEMNADQLTDIDSLNIPGEIRRLMDESELLSNAVEIIQSWREEPLTNTQIDALHTIVRLADSTN